MLNKLKAAVNEYGNDMRHRRSTDQVDTDANGVGDYLDIRRTDIDEKYKQDSIQLQKDKLAETIRKNEVDAELKRKALNKPSTSAKS